LRSCVGRARITLVGEHGPRWLAEAGRHVCAVESRLGKMAVVVLVGVVVVVMPRVRLVRVGGRVGGRVGVRVRVRVRVWVWA
jgi:hypothetical protein